jgi:hypothetical protein
MCLIDRFKSSIPIGGPTFSAENTYPLRSPAGHPTWRTLSACRVDTHVDTSLWDGRFRLMSFRTTAIQPHPSGWGIPERPKNQTRDSTTPNSTTPATYCP